MLGPFLQPTEKLQIGACPHLALALPSLPCLIFAEIHSPFPSL